MHLFDAFSYLLNFFCVIKKTRCVAGKICRHALSYISENASNVKIMGSSRRTRNIMKTPIERTDLPIFYGIDIQSADNNSLYIYKLFIRTESKRGLDSTDNISCRHTIMYTIQYTFILKSSWITTQSV